MDGGPQHQPFLDGARPASDGFERRVQSGSVTSVRNPRLPKFTPRIGTHRPACAMQSAMLRSVPSPPRTSTSPDARPAPACRPPRGSRRAASGRPSPFRNRGDVAGAEPRLDLDQVRRRRAQARLRDNTDVGDAVMDWDYVRGAMGGRGRRAVSLRLGPAFPALPASPTLPTCPAL